LPAPTCQKVSAVDDTYPIGYVEKTQISEKPLGAGLNPIQLYKLTLKHEEDKQHAEHGSGDGEIYPLYAPRSHKIYQKKNGYAKEDLPRSHTLPQYYVFMHFLKMKIQF